MMELLEDIFIRCGRCGRVIGIHKEDIDFDSYVYDRGENRMGEEIEFRHDGYIVEMKSPSEFLAMNILWVHSIMRITR